MKLLILGDTHHPFADYSKLEKVAAVAKKRKPDAIVQIGDLYDMYSFSDFPKNPNFITPEEEEKQGRAKAEEMWKTFADACPDAKRYQLHGNHDIRPVKRAKEFFESSYHVMRKHLRDLMSFDGVRLVPPEFELDGVIFQHGNEHGRAGPGICCKYNQQSTVIGHTHRPWVVWEQNRQGPFFELNAGWLGDHNSEAFDYRALKKLHKMINAYGWIEDGQPSTVVL